MKRETACADKSNDLRSSYKNQKTINYRDTEKTIKKISRLEQISYRHCEGRRPVAVHEAVWIAASLHFSQ
jgi:hypothetical protein